MGQDFLNLQAGTVVNGRYEIVRCLGTGSMGMVYSCKHRELGDHLVAMKVLFAEVARDEVAVARFRNEIVSSYGVNHPNVVRAYEYFRDNELVAFTMEYIEGGDLADRMGVDSEIAIEEIVRLLSQMCSGVQAIHDTGIVHRDLKPENILLTKLGDVKITDFGIARTGAGPKLTEHGGVVGTLDYVSPEYLEKGHVDTRSDIYALGVLGYEMLTGEVPFQGKSVIETMTLRLRSDPEAPMEKRTDCPAELNAIVMKALNRDPEARYQTAGEMLADLEAMNIYRAPRGSSRPEPRVLTTRTNPGKRQSATMKMQMLSEDEGDSIYVPKMESVLAPRIDRTDDAASMIDVSQSHLPAQRIAELSSHLYEERSNKRRSILLWGVFLVLGLGIGAYIASSMMGSGW